MAEITSKPRGPVTTPDEAAQKGVHVRPEVRKHFGKFMGQAQGRARLTVMKNRKDRYQMRQLLGFVPMKEVGA